MIAYNIFRKNQGATYQIDDDMFPCTVSRTSDNGKTVWIRMDKVSWNLDSNGNKVYQFTYDPDAREYQFHLTVDNKWKRTGNAGYLLDGKHYKVR